LPAREPLLTSRNGRAGESRPAIAPVELAKRVRRYYSLDAGDLAQWLLDARLATFENGLLRPTAAAVSLGGAIA
jgi:hypothetical protein